MTKAVTTTTQQAQSRMSFLRRAPTLAGLVGGVVALISLLIGLGPLNDNSFFTHLATGRIIWDTHHIPGHDPYSWTALGHPWVVQSWLASVLYAGAEKLGGPGGVLVLVGLTSAALGALVWMLTAPARALLGRLLIIAPVIIVGTDAGWVERPLLFGLVALALALLAAEGRFDPRWLIPVMWVWVNVHGSFPLGLVAIALLALGRRLDHESPSVELAALKWAGIGTLAGAISPLGPRVLMFPLELLSRQDVLSNVVEWKAPSFTHSGQRAFLVEVVLSIVFLARRPSWRTALPLAAFLAASLLGARNIVVASIVLIPGLARGLADLGEITGEERRPAHRAAAIALAAIAVLSMIVAGTGPVYSYDGYPVAAVTWASRNGVLGPDSRVVARDFVGNFIEARYGTDVKVFVDDRFDMFPIQVLEDFNSFNAADPNWDAILDTYHPTAVMWAPNEPFGQYLAASGRWRVVYTDQEFLIAVPR